MDFTQPTGYATKQITITNCLPQIGRNSIVISILEGLHNEPRSISSMFFYNADGSRLFEQITRLPEYYPPRLEKKLLAGFAQNKGGQLRDMDVVELGSGDCSKITIIFDVVHPEHHESLRYIPMDVSQPAIEKSAHTLVNRYPRLRVHGIVGDFLSQLHLIPHARRRLFFFLGSTIGNLSVAQQMSFFKSIGMILLPEDIFILGVDMVKSEDILRRAYNDSAGVTAAFNKNILNVVNSLAETDFDPQSFEHLAFYNRERSRIEMHLRAKREMLVTSPHLSEPLRIRENETIHTENSHKFTLEMVEERIADSGLRIETIDMADDNWFSLISFSTKQDYSHG